MNDRICAVSECERPVVGRDLCSMHWQRMKKYGSTDLPERLKTSELKCSVDNCGKPAKGGHGWCHMHYRRWRLHGSLELPEKPTRPNSCAVEGCNKGGRLTRGLCAAHYYRLRTHGDVQAHIPVVEHGLNPECTVQGCGRNDYVRRGLCGMHYQRAAKHGDPNWEQPSVPETCTTDGCRKPHDSKGLCQMHYMRLRRTGSLDTSARPRQSDSPCSIEGCTKPAERKGWCSAHYTRSKRHGDPLATVRERSATPPETCTLPGCCTAHFAKGLCHGHYQQANHLANKDVRNERMRQHYRDNREEYYAKTNRRRQRVLIAMDAVDRALSADYRRAIAQDPCAYCGKPSAHVDHYFPIAKGGTDHWWNLTRACDWCNRSKAARCGTWFALRTGAPWTSAPSLSLASK
ncbi:HNH endonuclease [Streptomyces sp. NPDC090106]|uniref:HNH endonuclease n=1 Tax=Streptomyces sp. NPDC090106 TaxID=3365946 RepID=UPI00382BE465